MGARSSAFPMKPAGISLCEMKCSRTISCYGLKTESICVGLAILGHAFGLEDSGQDIVHE
jgi:hypothetical protein